MVKNVLRNLVEWVCLGLMVILCADIFLGVFSRYVLVSTFTWYDEIARASFVWMVFLGAAVGVKRHAHFRLHLVAGRLPPKAQRAVEVFGFLVVIGFAAVLIHQGWILVELGRFQRTPVMGLPKSWIYIGIPAGGALMILYALGPLWRAVKWLAVGDGVIAAVAAPLGKGEQGR